MKCKPLFWTLCLFYCTGAMATESPSASASPEMMLEQSLGGDYAPVSREAADRAERLFRRLLENRETTEDDLGAWMDLGFSLQQLKAGGETLLALSETPQAKEGRGFFLFREKASHGRHILQAPHRRYDRGTGDLVLQLFDEGAFRAAVWNTIHRREGDLARLERSYFTALARATGSGGRDWTIQIHGFAKQKRKTPAGRASDIILSSGQDFVAPALRRLAGCLGAPLGLRVALYPEEVEELGGTRNPVGRTLRWMGADRFLHLELSAEAREALSGDPRARAALVRCLGELE